MQTKPFPEIDNSDLKAVREFLTSIRDEEHETRTAGRAASHQGGVPMRNGIARARTRSSAPKPA